MVILTSRILQTLSFTGRQVPWHICCLSRSLNWQRIVNVMTQRCSVSNQQVVDAGDVMVNGLAIVNQANVSSTDDIHRTQKGLLVVIVYLRHEFCRRCRSHRTSDTMALVVSTSKVVELTQCSPVMTQTLSVFIHSN